MLRCSTVHTQPGVKVHWAQIRHGRNTRRAISLADVILQTTEIFSKDRQITPHQMTYSKSM